MRSTAAPPTEAAPSSRASAGAAAERVRTCTSAPSAMATWAVMCADPPKPSMPRRPPEGPRLVAGWRPRAAPAVPGPTPTAQAQRPWSSTSARWTLGAEGRCDQCKQQEIMSGPSATHASGGSRPRRGVSAPIGPQQQHRTPPGGRSFWAAAPTTWRTRPRRRPRRSLRWRHLRPTHPRERTGGRRSVVLGVWPSGDLRPWPTVVLPAEAAALRPTQPAVRTRRGGGLRAAARRTT